jgi:hypothetical protein
VQYACRDLINVMRMGGYEFLYIYIHFLIVLSACGDLINAVRIGGSKFINFFF